MLRGSTPCTSATVETIRGTRSSSSSKTASGRNGALVGLGPEVGTGAGVHELHREAQRGSRLPEASLHHVAGAELPARPMRTSAGTLAYRASNSRAITRRYEKRDSPVTISSDSPSASGARSALAPRT